MSDFDKRFDEAADSYADDYCKCMSNDYRTQTGHIAELACRNTANWIKPALKAAYGALNNIDEFYTEQRAAFALSEIEKLLRGEP